MNAFYDSRTCNNGGGYHQPLLLIDGGDWKAVIADTSCGDFGSEVSIDIERGGVVYGCYYGSRVDDDQQWSNIEYNICADILEIFARYLGYHPPVKGEWSWEDPRIGEVDFGSEIIDRGLNVEDYEDLYISTADQEMDNDDESSYYFPWLINYSWERA